MNIFIVHGINNKFVDELLSFLHKYLLPADNCFPSNMYHAKSLTKKLSLNYKVIHGCPNGCVFFRGMYGEMEICPKVQSSMI
jgi:hypothetical protein